MTCKYKVKIKDIQYNYKVQMADIQSKYKFKVFCTGYDDSEIKEKIDAMYQAWPKVSGEGETITLNDTANTTMAIDLKGNTSQETTTGKNKLNPNLKPNGDRGIIGTYNNSTGEITITGTPTATFSNVGDRVDFATPLPAGTYTLSTEKVENVRIGLHLYKSGGDINNYAIALGNKELQITVTDEITGYYLYIYGLDSTKQYNQSFKAMFESGSSATDWEKYTGGNPAPNPDYPQTISNVTGTNTIKINGKNLFDNVYGQTENVYTKHINAPSPLGSVDCYPINLSPNTQYTLKIDMNGYRKTGAWIAGVCFENGDVISLLQLNSMADITTTTFTTDSTGVVYVGQRYGFTYGETGRMDLFLQTAKIQLEKGSTATTYEPYKEKSYTINLGSIELCKIGDYQDRIYSLNGKWYLEKFSEKVTIDGTNIAVTNRRETNTSGNYSFIFLFSKKAKRVDGTITQGGYCDKLVSKPRNNIYGRTQGFGYGATNNDYWGDIVIFRTDWATKTITDVNTDLKSNPIELEYLLDSAETIEITDSTLISQLEEIKEAESYSGQTNISQTNDDKPFILTAKALKDLSSL